MVAVVAIIVVGPKDLPGMLRTIGKSVKKLRGMAGDFQRQFDDALKEAELDEVKNSIDNVRSMNPLNEIKDSLNPLKDVAKGIENDINDDGPSDPGQEDDGDYSFDPDDLFDESKLVKPSDPVKVDVEAALAREKAKAAKRVTTKPSGVAAKSKGSKKKPAARKTPTKAAARKSPAKKAAARKPANKPAAKPKTRKSAKAQSA